MRYSTNHDVILEVLLIHVTTKESVNERKSFMGTKVTPFPEFHFCNSIAFGETTLHPIAAESVLQLNLRSIYVRATVAHFRWPSSFGLFQFLRFRPRQQMPITFHYR